MAQVLLHYPDMYSGPVGVWWWAADGSGATSYYLPGYEALQIAGNAMLNRVESAAQFDMFGQRLVDSMPFVGGWGWGEVADKSSPQELLAIARKKAS